MGQRARILVRDNRAAHPVHAAVDGPGRADEVPHAGQQICRLPEAERIEWLQDEGRTGSAPYLVRVHSDDRIEVGQTWDQFQEQQRIISLGYPVGRVDESGDWIPRVQNPLTGQWGDIEPGEILDA